MNNLQKEKEELGELAELLKELSPEARKNLKQGILIGKVIYSQDNKETEYKLMK